MVTLQLANDLIVRATRSSDESNYYVGVECSQPFSLAGATVARVSGVVQQVTGTDFTMHAMLDGSNDLSAWVAVHVELNISSGSPPRSFVLAATLGVTVPYAYGRVRWVLEPTSDPLELKDGQRVIVSAYVNTGRR